MPLAPLPDSGFISAVGTDAPFHAVNEHIHGSGCPERTDAHQYGYQVRNDAHGCGEAIFSPFYKCIVDVYLLPDSCQYKYHDDAHEQYVGCSGAYSVHGVFV